MTKETQNTHILLRGVEAGGITRADIERRARELALLRGRPDFDDRDLRVAARELAGEYTPAATTDDAETDIAVARDPSEPRTIAGRLVPNVAATADESSAPERLALQGVDEAQHDQMVTARQERRRRARRS